MRLANVRKPLGVLALTLLAGCGGDYARSTIEPVTDFGQTILGLYVSVFWWTMLVLALVWIALAVTLIRFRERPGAAEPKPTHGHLGLEIAWTIAPAFILIAIAIPTIQAIFETQQRPAEDAFIVDVVGHRFWWEFRYPDGVVTANELHLPVGVPVSLRLSSADIIHSFWVPQIGGKRDVNPLVVLPEGREPTYNWLHFAIESPGTYRGQCAEFCGDSHALMGITIIGESPEEFQAWLSDWRAAGAEPAAADSAVGAPAPEDSTVAAAAALAAAGPGEPGAPPIQQPGGDVEPQPTLAEQGRAIFHNSTCIACHTIRGTNAQGVLAPNLTLVGRRETIAAGWLENTPENLVRWITSPHAVKPGVLMPGVDEPGGNWPATGLTEDQVEAVAAYLTSLR